MANTVEQMPDSPRGPKWQYPWDEWLNGQTWRLVKGTDFPTTDAANFATYASRVISRRKLALKVSRDGPVVFIGPRT